MTKKNKHGLSRSIDSNTKRLIRQECGFGCMVCGNAIYQYEHIVPEFKDAKIHDKNMIGLLCGACHDNVTKRIWSKEKIIESRLKPFCLTSNSAKLNYDIDPSKSIRIKLGKVEFIDSKTILEIDGEKILSIHPPEKLNTPPVIQARFYDRTGNEIAWIDDNEWNGNPKSFDIESIGSKITIRSKVNKIDLEIALKHPNIFEINKLNLFYNEKYITGDKNSGFVISTKNSSFHLGLESQIYNSPPFGISIQGDKIFIGSNTIAKYVNLKGEVTDLIGHYEVKGGELSFENVENSCIPKLNFKTDEKGGSLGIKFNFPDIELPRSNLQFAKQQRNDPCKCGSTKKYKQCCRLNEEKIVAATSDPKILRISQTIFSRHKSEKILYLPQFSPKKKSAYLDYNELVPIVIINTSKTISINDIGYTLYFWDLIKEGFRFNYNLYTDFRENIIRSFQEVLFSIPVIGRMTNDGFDLHTYYSGEVDFIRGQMEQKVENRIGNENIWIALIESSKILRYSFGCDFLSHTDKEHLDYLFKSKSPVASMISAQLIPLIKTENIYTIEGYSNCMIKCFDFIKTFSQVDFSLILDALHKNK